MRSTLIAAFVAAATIAPSPSGLDAVAPAAAQEPRGEDDRSPGALAGEAMQKLMEALDLLIGSIPHYEAPYVDENGDIIIRRKRDDGLPTPERKPLPPDIDTTTT